MPAQKPNPGTWTFRLKYHMTTVLLHVDPLENLSSVKAELLKALQETTPTEELNGKPLPEGPEQFRLAQPNNINDPLSGWTQIDPNPFEDEGDGSRGRRKGKTAAGQSVKAMGLQDNAVLAFQWGEKDKNIDDGDMDVEEEEWDVVIPSSEDVFDDENEGGVAPQ
ncbi:hypothetical protein P152DRAFT_454499 [Eremomyces bilateralis CBS 781.70]|uniref:Uncharacterized protein n=1 Tax=Eremomyces bilateralis CBS 781.70 TaxID=1392243 RepID=A0A6G1GEE7_9PEZI|nr:uncharacterized protein P152DRAFT_454499 [Eremomyces bilateralis CBS 781.70]KAF1816240.1 hypothetical protein P152DRAFT_454499 [Eremomyces bilateralis CBS 781.70]